MSQKCLSRKFLTLIIIIIVIIIIIIIVIAHLYNVGKKKVSDNLEKKPNYSPPKKRKDDIFVQKHIKIKFFVTFKTFFKF